MEQITINKKYFGIIALGIFMLFLISIVVGIFLGTTTDDNRGLSKKTPWTYDDIIRMEYTIYLIIAMGIMVGLILHGFPFTIRSECIHEDMDR